MNNFINDYIQCNVGDEKMKYLFRDKAGKIVAIFLVRNWIKDFVRHIEIQQIVCYNVTMSLFKWLKNGKCQTEKTAE